MRASVRTAAALTRAWVRLYTVGMPADLRETRRAEIEADLWEHQRDAQASGMSRTVLAVEILLRTFTGLVDDLSWRVEAISARRVAAPERRMPMTILARRQTRWMGLAGLLGGILWAGRYLMPVEPATAVRAYGHIGMSILFIAGLTGFYAQQRGRAGWAGKAGFAFLYTSLVAWFAVNFLGTVFAVGDQTLVMNLLGVAFALPLGPGFLLLGLGLNGPARVVPLAIGCAFAAWVLVPRVLTPYFPAVANWNRGDSPLGIAVFFLMGIGLALMGYSVFRSTAPASGISH